MTFNSEHSDLIHFKLISVKGRFLNSLTVKFLKLRTLSGLQILFYVRCKKKIKRCPFVHIKVQVYVGLAFICVSRFCGPRTWEGWSIPVVLVGKSPANLSAFLRAEKGQKKRKLLFVWTFILTWRCFILESLSNLIVHNLFDPRPYRI